MRLNVVNEYTYTLETIVQAGRDKIAMTSVPIRTNGELRPSRLFSSMFGYVKKSMLTIIRAFMMYKPLRFLRSLGRSRWFSESFSGSVSCSSCSRGQAAAMSSP